VKNSESERRQLERDRAFLRRIGRKKLKGEALGKMDLSGLVQKTLMEAVQAGDRVPQDNAAERQAWLTRAFNNNLTDEFRRLRTAARDVTRERPLEETRVGSSGERDELAADHSTPSERACRGEQQDRMFAAVNTLPEDQRRVIELHYLQRRPISEVAALLGRSAPAVAGLLNRGMKALKARLDAASAEDES